MISNDALHVHWFGDCADMIDLEINVFIAYTDKHTPQHAGSFEDM